MWQTIWNPAGISRVWSGCGNWHLPIYACNNTLSDMSGSFRIIDTDTDTVIFEGNFTCPKNSTKELTKLKIFFSEQKILIFEWDIDGKLGLNHYLAGFPPFSFEKYKSVIQKYSLSEE